MVLRLIMRRPGGGSEIRTVSGEEFSIGRGPDNDWVLPGSDRRASRRHCVISWAHVRWQVLDLSLNGTFLNDEKEPIGGGNQRDLHDGDRLRIGGCEIAAQIGEAAPSTAATRSDKAIAKGPAESVHAKLARVRAPRVYISYERERSPPE